MELLKKFKIKPNDNESLEIKFYNFKDINLDRCLKMDARLFVNYFEKGIKELIVD